MTIQSVIFERGRFTEAGAREWLTLHGFKADGKMTMTDRYLRFRQSDPEPLTFYQTRDIGAGVKIRAPLCDLDSFLCPWACCSV